MEKNRDLYRRYFKVWIGSAVVCVILGSIIGFAASDINPKVLFLLITSIVALPMVVIGIYGLKHNYSNARIWNHIHRGKGAKFINILYLMIYVTICLFFLAKD